MSVIIEAESPLFGGYFGNDVVTELSELHTLGVAVALLSHGADLRGPGLYASHVPASPFKDA
ncbi:hypothetical protein I6E74_05260 [Salinibacterium sp. SWN139]|uniref:hypothetical protein n=1 Tax=Salinibacterium sp. SWN139 TaxID=2792055 RepID=UPI0018CCCF94|nr:hypothetical protein [Salinibacterium sp. SWN139]MBH0053580.1 hypothetical protein [Salinibacterium sp. SWN139]